MYSTVSLRNSIKLKSSQLGSSSNVNEKINSILKNKYENKIFGKINGYIIKIIDIDEKTIKNGVINDINGDISYSIEYIAAVFKPIKNEVIDITIDFCNESGIWGHLTILPEVSIIECICFNPGGYVYDKISGEWVKEEDDEEVIKEGSGIKLKITESQTDATKILIIGRLVA